jgi:hypothetical protein
VDPCTDQTGVDGCGVAEIVPSVVLEVTKETERREIE